MFSAYAVYRITSITCTWDSELRTRRARTTTTTLCNRGFFVFKTSLRGIANCEVVVNIVAVNIHSCTRILNDESICGLITFPLENFVYLAISSLQFRKIPTQKNNRISNRVESLEMMCTYLFYLRSSGALGTRKSTC